MFGVLLESRGARQRRDGGAAFSVATHVAIIGLVGAATAKSPPEAAMSHPIPVVTYLPRVERPMTIRQPTGAATIPRASRIAGPVLPAITMVPPTLPPIDLGAPSEPPLSDLLVGRGQSGVARLGVIDLGESDGSSANRDWDGTETLMRLVALAKPRYPDRLRVAGISGRVRVRFVVDSAGRVDLSSVQIVESTHELFSSAVRDVLPTLRFKPSEVNGQRVRSLAEMPFEFQITR